MRDECRVLVVADDSLGGAIRNALRGRVGSIQVATNASDGLALLKTEPVDVLFVSGTDHLARLRSSLVLHPHPATVVLADEATLECAVDAMRLGACDYLLQPSTDTQILEAFERVVCRRRVDSAETCRLDSPGDSPQHDVRYIATSSVSCALLKCAEKIAGLPCPVFIEGEAGVGKQLLARWIHAKSPQATEALIRFTGTALKEVHMGSEPLEWKRFVVRDAPELNVNRCTFYLEEVAGLPPWAQRQLLETIELALFGESEAGPSDAPQVRVIASNHTGLDQPLAEGKIDRGLYDLLHLNSLVVPPLRKRREDVRALTYHFLEKLGEKQGRDPGFYRRAISDETWESLERYEWPGNVRELASLLSSAIGAKEQREFDRCLRNHTSLPGGTQNSEAVSVPLRGNLQTIECHLVQEVIRRCGGNKAAAARALGMHRRTLYRVLKKRTSADRAL
jgi:DNA-binding NtrC family response regulator